MTIRILNIAILVAAILLSTVLVKKFFLPAAHNSDYQVARDARLIINGINWADSERTVLVALGKECKYCSESAEFYRRLAAGVAGQTNIRLIALFSEKESDGDAYLKHLAVPIPEVRYTSLSSLGIKSVPTLVLLDRNGVVNDMWVGKLSPLKESALMSKLRLDNTRSPDEWSINEANLERKVANKEPFVLLDIRERAAFALKHRAGARNIPLDELPARAQDELPLDQAIIIDGNEPSQCDLAYSILDSQGFGHVFVLIKNSREANKRSP